MITMVDMLRFGTTFRSTAGGIPGGTGKAKILFVVITMKNCPRKFNFRLYLLRKKMRCKQIRGRVLNFSKIIL